MSLRINLLKSDEFRQVGLLSQAFLIRMTAGVIGAVVVLVLALMMLRAQSVKKDLDAKRIQFRRLDPIWQDLRAMQDDVRSNQDMIDELQTWAKSRLEWHQVLLDLQATIPPTVQVTKLSTRGGLEMVLAPAWQQVPPKPARRYTTRLDGRVMGGLADEVVSTLLRAIGASEGLQVMAETVHMLQGLRKDTSTRQGDNSWSFGLEMIGPAIEMGLDGEEKKPQDEPQRTD